MADQPTVHQAVTAIIEALPGIPKGGKNQQQGYAFRAVEAVLDVLRPLLAKHGVHFSPEALDLHTSERPTKGGGVMNVVHTLMRYTFYGPSGDMFTASVWGEGSDSGDKATSKSATMCEKTVLLQVFCISTGDNPDPDGTTAPDTKGSKARTQKAAPKTKDSGVPATPQQVQLIRDLYEERAFDLPAMLKKAGFESPEDLPTERADKLVDVMEQAPLRG